MDANDSAAVIIFGKTPENGRVKTRLIPELGPSRTTELYRSLLQHTVSVVNRTNVDSRQLYLDGDLQHPFIKQLINDYPLEVYQQCSGDLGQRIKTAFSQTLKDHNMVVVMGSDCPAITHTLLDEAINSLKDQADVVVGPAPDGGYNLIGMKTLYSELFDDIRWSSDSVMQETRSRCKTFNYHLVELEQMNDVDTVSDLDDARRVPAIARLLDI